MSAKCPRCGETGDHVHYDNLVVEHVDALSKALGYGPLRFSKRPGSNSLEEYIVCSTSADLINVELLTPAPKSPAYSGNRRKFDLRELTAMMSRALLDAVVVNPKEFPR